MTYARRPGHALSGMLSKRIRQNYQQFRQAVSPPDIKWAIRVYTVCSVYDFIGSQILPKVPLPPVAEFFRISTGFLPWYLWAIIGMAILCIACIDFARATAVRFPLAGDGRRLSFVDFVGVAMQDYGWRFEADDLHAFDLVRAIKQAATDDIIQIDGTQKSSNTNETILTERPLISIPKLYWNDDIWIDIPLLFYNPNNRKLSSYMVGNSEDYTKRYFDLHFHDRVQALRWLASIESWKGRTTAQEVERKRRKEQVDDAFKKSLFEAWRKA